MLARLSGRGGRRLGIFPVSHALIIGYQASGLGSKLGGHAGGKLPLVF